MPTPWDLISKFLVPETDPAVYAKGLKMLATNPNLYGKMLAQQIQEQVASPEAAAFGGIDPMMGVVLPNYRTPQMIQALRKRMSEEMRSRGALGQIEGGVQKILTPEGAYAPVERIAGPDPIDRILRGSWYHGMSKDARYNVGGITPDEMQKEVMRHYLELGKYQSGIWKRYLKSDLPKEYQSIVTQESDRIQIENALANYPFLVENLYRKLIDPKVETALMSATERGFPISHHDALSFSNRLGEPSGISLTMLPTKAKQFSADEYIHRVHPLYGGPPQERTVNLMTPEGRRALNDAYDVAFNRIFQENLGGRSGTLQEVIGHNIGHPVHKYDLSSGIERALSDIYGVGPFNQALSQQLQSSGYRGLLYNPRRWNEYEMLMLDPKYVLPLDYRRVGEYLPKGVTVPGYAGVEATAEAVRGATPGIQKGLSQIQDLMSSNASRLGEIYSERPWTQRLSEENKRRLLELIDSKYREQVGRQLYGGP